MKTVKKRRRNPRRNFLSFMVLGGAAAGGLYLWNRNRYEHDGEPQPVGVVNQDLPGFEPVPMPPQAAPGMPGQLPPPEPSPPPDHAIMVRWGNGVTSTEVTIGQSRRHDPVELERVLAPQPFVLTCQWNEVLVQPRWYVKPYGEGRRYAHRKRRPPDDGHWYYVGAGGSVVVRSTLGAEEWPFWEEPSLWVALEVTQGDVILASGRPGAAYMPDLCGYMRVDHVRQ